MVLACRRRAAADQAAAAIRAKHPAADVSVVDLDLASLTSVRRCADEFRSSGRKLHLLINNAGTNFWGAPPFYTESGVGGCAQVNFLGAYCLTRMLHSTLAASAPSRIVTVSSVMHRNGSLRCGAGRFLREWACGGYTNAKLAEAVFAFELDRRLSAAGGGVRSVVCDPGAVQTNIWVGTPFAFAPVKALMDRLYAPPREGAASLIHAATVDLDTVASPRGCEPQRLFFARGLFASAPITADAWMPRPLWGVSTALMSICDQPLRSLSGGRLGANTAAVVAAPETYDKALGAELWSVAAKEAALPAEEI